MRIVEVCVLDAFYACGSGMARIGQAEVTQEMVKRSVLHHDDHDGLNSREILWHESVPLVTPMTIRILSLE